MYLDLDAIRARLSENSEVIPGPPHGFDGVNLPYSACRIWTGATNGARPPLGQITVRDTQIRAGLKISAHRKLYVHRLALWLKEHPKAKGRVRVPDTLPYAEQTCGNRLCIEHVERKSA